MLCSSELPTTLSNRVLHQNLSFINNLNQKSASLVEQGINVFKLSGGDPTHAPPELFSLIQDIGKDNEMSIFNYSPIAGLDKLRDALSAIIAPRYYNNYDATNILVCSGACSGLYLTFKTLLNNNDRVLIQDPCWEYLPRLIENCQGLPIKLNYFSNEANRDNWHELILEIEMHLLSGIKALVINSPLNPSGKIVPVEVINQIIKLCLRHNTWFIADDVTIDFNFKYRTNLRIHNLGNFISVNSFSKNIGVTGLRFGYVAAPIEFINQLKKSQLYTCMYPNSFVQELMLRYLSLGKNNYFDFINKVVMQFQNNAEDYVKLLQSISGLEVSPPDGGLFLFPKLNNFTTQDCVNLLNEYHLAVAPGEAFSPKCIEYFRIFLGAKMEIVTAAIQKIKKYSRHHN